MQRLESSEKERQNKSAQETSSKQAEFLSEISKRIGPKFPVALESNVVQELKELRSQLEAVKAMAESQCKQADAVQCESKATLAKMEELSSAHLERLVTLQAQAQQHVPQAKQMNVPQNDPASAQDHVHMQRSAFQIQHGQFPQLQSFPAFPPQYQSIPTIQAAQPASNVIMPQGHVPFPIFHDTMQQRAGPVLTSLPGYVDHQFQAPQFEGLLPQGYPVSHSYQHMPPIQRGSFSGTPNMVI